MAATVVVQEGNTATPTWTDKAVPCRYAVVDSHDPGSGNPCIVPTAGLNYSFWKHHRLKFTGIGTSVTNIKWFCAGNPSWLLGTGGGVDIGIRAAGDNGCPEGNYEQAAGPSADTGYAIDDGSNGHDYYNGGGGDGVARIGTYVTGNRLVLDTSTLTASPSYSKSAVTQVEIDTDATQGEKTDITYTFAYDEI